MNSRFTYTKSTKPLSNVAARFPSAHFAGVLDDGPEIHIFDDRGTGAYADPRGGARAGGPPTEESHR